MFYMHAYVYRMRWKGCLQEKGGDLRWEKPLLDDRERERVLEHCALVVQCGAIPWLVRLCASADGPLEERDPSFDPAASGKKGKGKKGKKGKKAKLEPGAWPTACAACNREHTCLYYSGYFGRDCGTLSLENTC